MLTPSRDDIDDAIAFVDRPDPPVDPNRRKVRIANFAADQGLSIGVGDHAKHVEYLAAVAAQTADVGPDDEVPEQDPVFRALIACRAPPVATERETRHGVEIEALVQQVPELGLALVVAERGVRERADRPIAERVDEVNWAVVAVLDGRGIDAGRQPRRNAYHRKEGSNPAADHCSGYSVALDSLSTPTPSSNVISGIIGNSDGSPFLISSIRRCRYRLRMAA